MPLPRLQASIQEFWAGLRARNWTAGKHFQPQAAPWRVQLFSCSYDHGTGWDGLRALVTESRSASTAASASKGSSQNQATTSSSGQAQAVQFWVDLPRPGAPVPMGSKVLSDPADAGYNAVLAQLYQAYEQRLTKAARKELASKGYITPGAHTCVAGGWLM